jgi:putative ABC transport system permease protein
VIRALDRKLLRESWQLRGQLLSIAVVVACGVMTLVTMRGTYESLAASLERYYASHAFADVFVELERAPQSLASRVATLPGVAAVDTRVTRVVSLDVPGLGEPAVGMLVSLPEPGARALNEVHLVHGRGPDPGAADEVLVSESFFVANGLALGDTLGAVVAGRWRRLAIVGVAISPDYIGEVAPGAVFPDDRRFGVLRLPRAVLAPALGLDGAFNELSLRLAPGASDAAVVAALDRVLEPYGGRGAYGRARHPSHEAVAGELEQNRVFGTLLPGIFLLVAAFLLSVVMRRLVGTQRAEIAVLKAFGYGTIQVARHYLRFALLPVVGGTLAGTALGVWLGGLLTALYGRYFRFPDLAYEVSWGLVALAAGVGAAAAAVGALGAVRAAAGLPPAEAMRPEAPARFRAGPAERLGLGRRLNASGRLILRNVERRPLRAIASVLGVASAVAILVVGMFFHGALDHMLDVQFRRIQREDLAVGFDAPRPLSVRRSLEGMEGVQHVEAVRTVPVRLRSGHLQRTTVLTGVPPDATLRRVLDVRGRPVAVPVHGLLLNRTLAERLRVGVGDTLRVEVLQGERVQRAVPVAAIVDEMFGTAAYLDFDALHRLLGEGPAVSGAYLRIDPPHLAAVTDRLKRAPAVASAYSPAALRASFEAQMAETLLVSVAFLTLLASVLAVGVVYNGARIALAERGRELASLRVLGFTRREVAGLLLGEQTVLTLLAVPVGWAIGYGFVLLTLAAFTTERFRVPLVVTQQTYLVAAGITLVAAVAAGIAVRRRLDRMDLIGVLKTRE